MQELGKLVQLIKLLRIYSITKYMKRISNRFSIKDLVDTFLIINLFLVIIFGLFFLFSVIMELNGKSIFLDYFRSIWDPLIISLITILIISSLINGIISWLIQKEHSEGEDI